MPEAQEHFEATLPSLLSIRSFKSFLPEEPPERQKFFTATEHCNLMPAVTNMSQVLPQEVLQQVFSYLIGDQKALHACSLTSTSWYSASIAYLYENPIITGKNYDPFVRAICPSVNAHVRRNGLADLVRRLDMSSLVHNGSKSLTARLLGRVKTGLEEFVAPQASFAYVLPFI